MKTDDKKILAWILFMFWSISLSFSFLIAIFKENLNWFIILLSIFTFIAIMIYIIVARYWNKKEIELQEAILQTNIDQVDTLTPYEFEEWVARLLRIAGYNATATKKSGDYGVDVIAEKDNERIAIQVKKFSKPVGIKAVQEVISGMDYYNCYDGWVVTTAPYFTQAAKNLANTRDVKLYNKNDLALMLYNLQKENNSEFNVESMPVLIEQKFIEEKPIITKEVVVKKIDLIKFNNEEYEPIKQYIDDFENEVLEYLLNIFNRDKILDFEIDKIPYMVEYFSNGNYLCKQMFGMLDIENEKSHVEDIEHTKLNNMFYVGMGAIYLWKNRKNFELFKVIDVLIKNDNILNISDIVLQKFKIDSTTKVWKNFEMKFYKCQVNLLNDFNVDYIFHKNDLKKYYKCMHAMFILGTLFAIKQLDL